jgi:hypothetical protein
MRFSLYLAGAAALPLLVLGSSNTVRFPIKHKSRAISNKRAAGPISVSLSNAEKTYLVELQVGTPPQTIQTHLDTGSSDLWFPTQAQCPDQQTCPDNFFTPGSSSTFKDVAPGDFSITYGDGSAVTGDYFTDVLTIGDTTVTAFTMAVANSVTGETQIESVFGVGFQGLESSVSGTPYDNYPIALVKQGFTESVSYSLWLDDLEASTGSILFSGVDSSKFCGDLTILDIQDYETQFAFFVTVDSLSFTSSSGTSTVSSGAVIGLLDSGTSLTVLPQAALNGILPAFPSAQYDSQAGVYIIDCSEGQTSGSFTVNFGATSINVARSELVLSEDGLCILGFQAGQDGQYILGDTFLRSAYVVYDLINLQIGIAPSSFDPSSSNVVAFPSYGAHIPSVKGSSSCGGSSNSTTTTTATTTTSTKTGTGGMTTKTGTGGAPTTTPGNAIPPPLSTGPSGGSPPPHHTTSPGGGSGGTSTGSPPPVFTGGAATIFGGSASSAVAAVFALGAALMI